MSTSEREGTINETWRGALTQQENITRSYVKEDTNDGDDDIYIYVCIYIITSWLEVKEKGLLNEKGNESTHSTEFRGTM